MPVMQYIIRRRLLHGIYEMSQGEKKIDIALKYGFLTYSGFYKAFVREFSCTPAEYIALGRVKKPHPIKLAERKHCMMTHKKVSEIAKHWGLEKELISDIFYEGNGERCEDAFFIGDDFVLKCTSDFNEMQNHISLAKSLENVGLLTAVPVKTKSGEEYVVDGGIYFYLTKHIKGKEVTAQSFYTNDTNRTANTESRSRFIGEILGQLSLALKDIQMQAKEINLSKDISERILPKGKALFPEYALFLQRKLNELKLLCDSSNDELPCQIIHRDLNPSNILMTDEQWGILDFDLAERNIRIYDPCYAATAILSESFEAGNDQKLQQWCQIYKNILYGYDSVVTLTETEWKAVPYVVLVNQLVCTIWFSQKEQYQKLYEINKKMTMWVMDHFDQLLFEED
jgi:Ser/Thr protein kinase RdoA (MazF antagonist)